MVVEVSCDNCGSSIEKYSSHVRENNFCNKDCQSEWQSEVVCGENHPSYNKKEVSCDNCGDTFKRKPSVIEKSDKTFCSIECRDDSYQKEDWNFGPESTVVDVECDNCGVSFEKDPSRVERSEHDFCTKDCHYQFASNNDLRAKENNPYWNGGDDSPYYGPNWNQQRRERLEKDGYECVRCGMSDSTSQDVYDCSLNIHHIIPIKEFNGDYESANEIENLVTLCNSCHITVEVLSPSEQKKLLFGDNK